MQVGCRIPDTIQRGSPNCAHFSSTPHHQLHLRVYFVNFWHGIGVTR